MHSYEKPLFELRHATQALESSEFSAGLTAARLFTNFTCKARGIHIDPLHFRRLRAQLSEADQ